jgi:hypothetical protein
MLGTGGLVAHICNLSYLGESEIGRITVWGQPKQIVHETPISKITRAELTASVAQAVKHLLSQAGSPKFKPQSHKKKKL